MQVAVSGEVNYQQHLGSKRHAKRLTQLAAGSLPAAPAVPAAELAGQQAQAPKAYVGAGAADVAPYVDQVGLLTWQSVGACERAQIRAQRC